jgi:general stress protein 26
VRVDSFADNEPELNRRVREIVWCNVATVNRQGRPCSRILHPIWRGSTGWILTSRHSPKEKHLAKNPYVSLCYANTSLEQVYAECRAEWEDRPDVKSQIWDLFAGTPPPVGYDPIAFWPGGKQDPSFGVWKLTPWRIEVTSLADLMKGGGKIWSQ